MRNRLARRHREQEDRWYIPRSRMQDCPIYDCFPYAALLPFPQNFMEHK